MTALSLRQIFLEDKYLVMHTIGSGHFGDIRVARNVETNENFAVKIEDATKKSVKLPGENIIYQVLLKKRSKTNVTDPSLKEFYGFPITFGYGQFEMYNYLLMELFGYNLESLFNSCNRRFSPKCVAMIGLQLLARLEFVHSCKIIYRDVKPENFVITKENSNKGRVIYMIDFGLAKEMVMLPEPIHVDSGSLESSQKQQSKAMRKVVGTCRYMSLNAHKGHEQTYRDDLESLAYILIYFLRGTLPWQGIVAEEIHDKYQRIYDLKKTTLLTNLCKGIAVEFQQFLAYVRLLSSHEIPNYDHLKDLLKDVLINNMESCDWEFDWIPNMDSIEQSTLDTSKRGPSKPIGSNEVFCSKTSIYCGCCGFSKR